MSMSVVKMSNDVSSVQQLNAISSELALNPSHPMPLLFSEGWEQAKLSLISSLPNIQNKTEVDLGEGRRFLVERCKWSYRLAQDSVISKGSLGSALLLVTGGVVASFGATEIVTFSIGFLCLGAALPTVIGSILTNVIAGNKVEKVNALISANFAASYEERVIKWAHERYGVTIPAGAWTGSADRVSKDIAYLGVKDGENVYCQERPEGWVLTYNDGTELPVLVGQKELVKA